MVFRSQLWSYYSISNLLTISFLKYSLSVKFWLLNNDFEKMLTLLCLFRCELFPFSCKLYQRVLIYLFNYDLSNAKINYQHEKKWHQSTLLPSTANYQLVSQTELVKKWYQEQPNTKCYRVEKWVSVNHKPEGCYI